MPQLWRHLKRETVYEIVAEGVLLQCSTAPAFEEKFRDDSWIVYRNVKTGAVYVRLTEEFMDGRFEQVEDGDAGG